jgi:hypothetical protein
LHGFIGEIWPTWHAVQLAFTKDLQAKLLLGIQGVKIR